MTLGLEEDLSLNDENCSSFKHKTSLDLVG